MDMERVYPYSARTRTGALIVQTVLTQNIGPTQNMPEIWDFGPRLRFAPTR
jgi:hypothetical protein